MSCTASVCVNSQSNKTNQVRRKGKNIEEREMTGSGITSVSRYELNSSFVQRESKRSRQKMVK